MAELQEQLQAILGNPEAMSQITAIARTLTGSHSPEPPSPPPEAQDVEFVPVEDPPSVSEEGPEEVQNQTSPEGEAAPDLGTLFGMLGGGAGLDIDPKLLQIALRVFSEYSTQDDEKVALLSALTPFLRAERLEKMEKAERIARLSRVVRVAIQLFREEGDAHV